MRHDPTLRRHWLLTSYVRRWSDVKTLLVLLERELLDRKWVFFSENYFRSSKIIIVARLSDYTLPMFSMFSHRKTVFVTKTLFAHPKNNFHTYIIIFVLLKLFLCFSNSFCFLKIVLSSTNYAQLHVQKREKNIFNIFTVKTYCRDFV